MRSRLLVLGWLVACQPSLHDTQVQSAKDAQARGDTANAAAWWDAACRSKPDDTDACHAAAKIGDQLSATSIQKATPACESGDIDTCATALRDIRRLRPSDTGVTSVLQKGALAYRAKCQALEAPPSLDSTLRRADCMMQKTRMLADPGFEMMAQEERDHAAQIIADAASSRSPAAKYTMYRTAQCLSRRIEPGARTQAAATELLELAQPISVRVRNAGSTALSQTTLAPCKVIQEAMGARARCLDASPARDLALDIAISLGRIDHRVSEEIQIARYQSGVESVPNPEWRPAESEARRTQRSVEEIEQDTNDRKATCDRTHDPGDCDRYNSAVAVYNRRIQDRDDARRRLADTPMTLEHPVFATVPYTIRHHSWEAQYSIDGHSIGGEVIRDASTISFEDSEHPAVAPAGIAEDPLDVPRLEDFDRRVRDAVVRSATQTLQRAFEHRATCATKSWSFDGPDLECRTISELYLKGPLPSPDAWLGSGVECR